MDAISRNHQSELVAPRSGSVPPGTVTNTSPHSQSSRNRRASQAEQQLPLHVPFNQPIHQHVWRSKRRLWTQQQLIHEREEFFETRVTGRAEVWAALRAAITLLQEGDVQTAQTIIDAAGVTVPTGDLCQGAYDENGALYRLPQCIVSDPENIQDRHDPTESHDQDGLGGSDDHDHGGDGDGDGDGISDRKLAMSEESEEELIPEDIERRREEKGKMSERDLIKVKSRLSDRGGPDLTVSIGKNQGVGVLARKIHIQAGVSEHLSLALIA